MLVSKASSAQPVDSISVVSVCHLLHDNLSSLCVAFVRVASSRGLYDC